MELKGLRWRGSFSGGGGLSQVEGSGLKGGELSQAIAPLYLRPLPFT